MLSFNDFLMTTWEKKSKPEKQEQAKKRNRKFLTKVPNLKVILENSIISSAKKIGRPILVNLPTYYVRFSSYHAQPTYLPKIGRH